MLSEQETCRSEFHSHYYLVNAVRAESHEATPHDRFKESNRDSDHWCIVGTHPRFAAYLAFRAAEKKTAAQNTVYCWVQIRVWDRLNI